ncbi:MAG: hypothetical protein FJ271_01660 [Planctomycetes bacterium]|nr:hypothetical protein [Planctomycetota bacterium]
MTSLADLHRTVQATLAGKRLGTAVFVRYLLHSPDKAETAPLRLAWLAGVVRDWLGQPLEQIYAHGRVKDGHLDLTLEFRQGATAIIHWSAVTRAAAADVMILGNHGALYHEGDGTYSLPPAKPDAVIAKLVERALRSGRPEGVD